MHSNRSCQFRAGRHVVALMMLIGAVAPPANAVQHIQASEPSVSGILGERVPGAEKVEGRLLAPCCWNQTLDIHGSEIALALRREIRTRLKAGESPEVIEASLVDRYGARLRAVPERVPLDRAAFFGWCGFGLAGVGLAMLLLRWRSRRAAGSETGGASSVRDELDERLDAELRRMD